MGDNLHELNRKELKELCGRNNIRTAGVKHEDLVRLLRNKMYPLAPHTPRSTRARGPKVLSPGKEDSTPYKTPGKPAPDTVRNLRSSTLPREDAAARRNFGSSRKPLIAKSNTMSSRRTNLSMKTPAVEQDATQENFVRRLCQINGLSPLSRKGQLDSPSKASRLSVVNSDCKTEDMTSPRTSEGNANNTADVEPSEAGSDASRRISEIATDAGPETLSDFSDADEFRSVSSEPISKLSSIGKRSPLRTQEESKMSQSRLSSFTAGTWDTSDHSRGMDSLVGDENNSEKRDVPEVIFPEFPEGSNFLVGDSEALDLSFLHAGAADPEVISNGSDHEEIQVKGNNHAVQKLDVMNSPMARDYVNYTRGSETDLKANCTDSNRVSNSELTLELGENPGDLNMENSSATSIDVADKQRDSTAIVPAEDAESKEVGHISDLAPGCEGKESEQSSCGITNSDHGVPISEDVDDRPEIHSELPCFESNSPPFDSKDFSVAKKLVFEPEGTSSPSVSLRQPKYDAVGEEESSNFQSSEGEPVLSVPKTSEDEDSSLHTKSFPSLDEPGSQHGGLAETVSETLPTAFENISSDVDCGEQDVSNSKDLDGGLAETVSETPPAASENISSDVDCGEQDVSNSKDLDDGLAETVSETLPTAFENISSDVDCGEKDVSNSKDLDGGLAETVSETLPTAFEKTSSDVDCGEQNVSNSKDLDGDLAETVSETLPTASENISSDVDCGEQDVRNSMDLDGGIASVEEFDAPAKQNDAGTSSSGQQQESELADSRVPSEGADSFEAEDLDTLTLERHASLPEMDMSSVPSANTILSDSRLTSKSSGNVTPEKQDRSNTPASEQEGPNIKARDGESASTSTTELDCNKEEGEKEKISFPMSIILWCSQLCSLAFRFRTPRLGS